jgi:hypothetical protein
VTSQIVPLIERGQKKGVFRSDVSASWLVAVIRSIVHTASAELRSGRISEVEVEPVMLTTALAAISGPKR